MPNVHPEIDETGLEPGHAIGVAFVPVGACPSTSARCQRPRNGCECGRLVVVPVVTRVVQRVIVAGKDAVRILDTEPDVERQQVGMYD